MALTILIVDDSSTMRAMIRRVVDMAGLPVARVLEAAQGAEGLELMRREWVDLVLADLNMPVMGGQEMIAAMRQDTLLAATPVVVVSSEGDRLVLESLAAQGVSAVVQKPFDAPLLRKTIERALGAGAAGGSHA